MNHLTDAQKDRLCTLMRHANQMFDFMINSMSGSDVADSEAYRLERLVYVDVHDGKAFDVAFAQRELEWRAYAAAQERKVNAAPKIKRGPSAGHSVISHRWVDPERFASKRNHMRGMIERALKE